MFVSTSYIGKRWNLFGIFFFKRTAFEICEFMTGNYLKVRQAGPDSNSLKIQIEEKSDFGSKVVGELWLVSGRFSDISFALLDIPKTGGPPTGGKRSKPSYLKAAPSLGGSVCLSFIAGFRRCVSQLCLPLYLNRLHSDLFQRALSVVNTWNL